jgi:hypothetical protein
VTAACCQYAARRPAGRPPTAPAADDSVAPLDAYRIGGQRESPDTPTKRTVTPSTIDTVLPCAMVASLVNGAVGTTGLDAQLLNRTPR